MTGWRRAAAAGLLALTAWSLGGLWALAGPPVPTMSQRSLPWARQALGSDRVDTIGSAGCALTAGNMVGARHRDPTNPAQLNQWLTAHGGYIENDLLLWRQATAVTQGSVRWQWLHVPGMVSQLRTDDQDIEDLPPQSLVEAQLDAGRLVVAEVRLYGGMHFVVITGHRGDILYINDPWFGDRTTLQARHAGHRPAGPSAQVYSRTQRPRPSGRGGELVVVLGRTPLTSPLRDGGTQVLEGVLPKQGAVEFQHLAGGRDFEMAAVAGNDLVHPVDPVPGDQARLTIEPGMPDRPERDALAGDGHLDPLDEEAVKEEPDAEREATAHRDRERREGAAVRLRDLDDGQDEAERARRDRHARPEDYQPVQWAIRPKAHTCC